MKKKNPIEINTLSQSNVQQNSLSSPLSNPPAHGLGQNRWPYSPARAQARNLHTWVSVLPLFSPLDTVSVSFSCYALWTSSIDGCNNLQNLPLRAQPK